MLGSGCDGALLVAATAVVQDSVGVSGGWQTCSAGWLVCTAFSHVLLTVDSLTPRPAATACMISPPACARLPSSASCCRKRGRRWPCSDVMMQRAEEATAEDATVQEGRWGDALPTM